MKGTLVASAGRAAGHRRWPLVVAATVLLVIVLAAGRAVGPYLFRVATLQSEIATQLRLTTGLRLAAPDHARFDLLPSPRIRMSGVHVSDPSGTVTIDAESLRGDVRLLPLLVGRIELASATLVEPRLVINTDGRPMPPDSLIGRAIHARPGTAPGGDRRLGTITLVGGSATIVGRRPRAFPRLSDIAATVDWRDLDSPATLTGMMRIADTPTNVAAWIERPSALMRGDRSAAALRLRSTPLDLSASGDILDAVSPIFKGHVAATAPSLPALVGLCGGAAVLPAPFADVTLTGDDARVAVDRAGTVTLDLPSVHLAADGNSFEGALAYRGAGTPLLSGTLASEQLNLAPFLNRLPPLLGPSRGWSRDRLPAGQSAGAFQLDMRISASHLRLPPFSLDDAAISVMTRGERVEIALNEAKAYGGALKGRLSIGGTDDTLNLRGAGTLDGADAALLGWDAFGRQIAAGSLSGSASFETTGDSVAALVGGLRGWAKGAMTDGDLTGLDLGLGLRSAAEGKVAETRAALKAGRTPFQSATFDMRLDDGIATIGRAAMLGRDSDMTATGNIDLGARTLDLHAVAATPAAGAPGPAVKLPLAVGGTFDKASITPEIAPPPGATPH